jgi:hypothetical protein
MWRASSNRIIIQAEFACPGKNRFPWGDFDMADMYPERDAEDEEQPKPTQGKFNEIYNPVTGRSYIYRDGEWVPKPDPRMDRNREAETRYGFS